MAGPGPQADGVNWVVQVGPQVAGQTMGYVWGNTGSFYVSPGPGSDPGGTYAYYMTDGSGGWVALPNNSVVGASGNNLEWQIFPPTQGLKFLIGIPS